MPKNTNAQSTHTLNAQEKKPSMYRRIANTRINITIVMILQKIIIFLSLHIIKPPKKHIMDKHCNRYLIRLGKFNPIGKHVKKINITAEKLNRVLEFNLRFSIRIIYKHPLFPTISTPRISNSDYVKLDKAV